jgi:hypothetical protein
MEESDIVDRVHAVEIAQATQATQAATLAGAQATQAAAQVGTAATGAAMATGNVATMAAASVALIVGIFLGIAIRGGKQSGTIIRPRLPPITRRQGALSCRRDLGERTERPTARRRRWGPVLSLQSPVGFESLCQHSRRFRPICAVMQQARVPGLRPAT